MKPSEFIADYNATNLNGLEEDEGDIKFNKLLKILDKQFIDREELKDKINNEFELHRTIFKHKAIFTEKGFNNLKKKILELIDKLC